MLRLEKIKKVNDVEILIISNSTDFTTDYICIELNKRTNKYLRINRDLFRSYSVDFCIDTLELLICISYTINIQHLLSLVKLLNPRRIHRNVRL